MTAVRLLEKAEDYLSAIAALLLILLGLAGVFIFLGETVALFHAVLKVESPAITDLLDTILWIFVIIELLKIALAYILRQNVIMTVFEATFVAVMRKIILLGTSPFDFNKAAALALITLSIGITWHLTSKKT